jgi:tripartite-type tricarboxylate transporter receptor subunit TctC
MSIVAGSGLAILSSGRRPTKLKTARGWIRMFARMLAASLIAAYILAAGAASAQPYPSHPITLVAPFPPGGATDTIARIMQDSMSQSLGQQIVIENVGGAGGSIGAARAARAAPDGYTVLLHNPAVAIAVTLYAKPGFDTEKDFVTIGPVNIAATTVVGSPMLPPSTMAELVRWMKEPGQNAKIAHAGVGSFAHLCGVLFAQEVGATVTQVPYRGAGPALNDLLAGHADLSCQSAAVAGPLIKAGKLKGYAILGKSRFAGLPDVPTTAEAGYKKLDLGFWHILFAPAGTPRPIVDRLNAALRHALADATVRKTFDEGGMELFPPDQQTPEAASALLKREIKLWGDVIRANNISAQ